MIDNLLISVIFALLIAIGATLAAVFDVGHHRQDVQRLATPAPKHTPETSAHLDVQRVQVDGVPYKLVRMHGVHGFTLLPVEEAE